MTFTISYDLEEEEEDSERVLQLMIILEVEYGGGHLRSTILHSYVIGGYFLPGWLAINLHASTEKYHILGIFLCQYFVSL